MSQLGFLMVTMEPSSVDEQEFHDWYDTEHVPERIAIDGFLNAQRWVCAQGWPRYVATYDLASPNTVNEPGYQAVSGDNFSPWSKRVLSRVRGLYRVEATQVHPGKATLGAKGRASSLVILRFRGGTAAMQAAFLEGLKESFEKRPEHLQTRLFKSSGADPSDFIALVELRTPLADTALDPRAFGAAAECLDLVNVYSPYWRRELIKGVPGK